jgi:ATP-binding cassette subfamily B (MDR/TAP) protein 1
MSKAPEVIKLDNLDESQMEEKSIGVKHTRTSEIKEQDKNEEKSVSYFQLQYKFADKVDYILIIFATLGSIVAGAAMPLISLLLGAAINNFGPDADKKELQENVKVLAVNFVICGLGILLGSFVMFFFWSLVSKRLIQKINTAYFQVLLKQEQGYFDQGEKNDHFVTKINQEIKIIENGVIFIPFFKLNKD